jgi:hypothetical protein
MSQGYWWKRSLTTLACAALLTACGEESGTESTATGGTAGAAGASSAGAGGSVGVAGSGSTAGDASGGAAGGSTATCESYRVQGADFVLSVHASGEVASLQISSEELAAFAASTEPVDAKWPEVIAPHFADQYEWHLYVVHEGEAAVASALLGQNGRTHQIQGINIGSDPTKFPDNSQLLAVMYLSDDAQLGSGTLLHEMSHTWANHVVPELDGHWHLSDVGGLLGGEPRGTIQDLGGGQYAVPFGGATEPRAADIEMYLAGLWPKEKVEPFVWVRNAVYQSTDQDTFEALYTGEGLVRVTIDDVIAEYGARIPDHTSSVRDFRMLPIIVTDVPLSPGDWDFYRWQLARFTAATPAEPYRHTSTYFAPTNLRRRTAASMLETFVNAWHGEATLSHGGALEALRARDTATCSPPTMTSACARLQARAEACDVAPAACHVDQELSAADAECIAGCAEKASCADIAQAESGTITFDLDNPYLGCAFRCQCTKLRNCYIVE